MAIGVFPAYIVIDRDGTVAAAAEDDHGFADLRKLLKNAGLDIEWVPVTTLAKISLLLNQRK